MVSILEKSNIKKYQPYVFIVVAVILFELLPGNFSYYKMKLCKPTILAQNIITDSEGHFETEYVEVNQKVNNIFVDLKLDGCEKAEVKVSLSDEGDEYPYDLTPFYIVPKEKSTSFVNIYPFGDVRTIKVSVTVPEWAHAEISSIAVNAPLNFDFKWCRFLAITIILFFLYGVRSNSLLHNQYCKRQSKKQFLISMLFLLFVLMAGAVLVQSNTACVKSPWVHQHQYQELAKSLSDGSVELRMQPDAGLLKADNPYDTIALEVNQIPFQMDHAYYEGKYYVYFGIIPEILLYLPYFLLTGNDLPNFFAMYVFFTGFCIGVFGLVWELVHRYGRQVPFFHYILLCLSICGGTNFVFMTARPDLYNIPIMAANSFTVLGLFFWLRGLSIEKMKGIYYFVGSMFMAMVAGCRPQMLLFSVIGCVLFYSEIVQNRRIQFKKEWRSVACLLAPYILIFLLVFWYNAARFGSGFDFGASYSLTSNDMNHRGFNLSRVFHGLFSFFIQPATIKSTFPFVFSSQLDGAYMGKNMTEFTFGGVFASNFILWIFLLWVLEGKHKLRGETKALAVILPCTSFAIALFDVNWAGILQRYLSDMVIGLIVLAAIMWVSVLSNNKENVNYQIWSRIAVTIILCGFLYSFFVIFAKGDSVCLQNDNPVLYYRISSYFKF